MIDNSPLQSDSRTVMFKSKLSKWLGKNWPGKNWLGKNWLCALAAGCLSIGAHAQNIAISNVALTEGDTGTVNFDFPISLSAPAAAAINLNYSTTAGSATAGSDFVAVTAGTITIPIGASTAVARVVVNGDLIVETQETFTVTIALQAGSPGTIVTNQALGQINNDDAAVLSVASVTQAEGNAAGSVNFVASLSRPVQGAVTVRVTSSDDSATAPADYTALNQVLNFASNATTANFTVASAGELVVEANERFALTLSDLTAPALIGPSVSLSSTPIFGTLNNDDNAAITISAPSQLEGNAGTTAMPFAINLSAPVQGGVSFTATAADGTATVANNDYQAATSAISFVGLSTTAQTFNVNIVGDLTLENDENFVVNLTGLTLPAGIAPASVTLATGGTGTIRNDDAVVLSINNAQAPEASGVLTFTVNLVTSTALPVSVQYATTNGFAIAGQDYVATSGTLTFQPGQTSQTIAVPLIEDGQEEGNETFTMTLSNSSPAAPLVTLNPASAIGTIVNDDQRVPVPGLGWLGGLVLALLVMMIAALGWRGR
jgi:large repetitive protein